MRVLVQDVGEQLCEQYKNCFDKIIYANGKYEHCIGCFKCWTKHPQQCEFDDFLKDISSIIGEAEELAIVTNSKYGCYSTAVKTILDRSVGASSPLMNIAFTEVHNISRHKMVHRQFSVYSYGDLDLEEQHTFESIAKRNCKNYGYATFDYEHLSDLEQLKEKFL